MPNKVIDLEVNRVDLVKEGANSEAFIKLYKRKEHDIMNFEEIISKMKPEHAQVIRDEIAKAKEEVPATASDELKKAKDDVASLTTQLKDANEKVSKSKEEQPSEEDVIKGLDPAVQAIFKSLKAKQEAAEEVAKKLNEEKVKEEAIAKAKSLSNIPVAEDKLTEVLKSMSAEQYEVLKAANDAIEKGVLIEKGTTCSNEDVVKSNAWSKIEKKAEEIAKRDNITKEKAVSVAIRENEELYKEYLEGGN